jgi:hypothetical protein
MAIDALRSYLQLASGFTDLTKERAKAAAQALVAANPLEGGTSAVTAFGTTVTTSASSLADELLAASKANRQLLIGLIRSEVDRTVRRLGLASSDELDALAARVARIERAGRDVPAATKTSAPKKTAAKKTPAKQTPAKQTAAEMTPVAAPSTAAAPATSTSSTEAAAPTTEGGQ